MTTKLLTISSTFLIISAHNSGKNPGAVAMRIRIGVSRGHHVRGASSVAIAACGLVAASLAVAQESATEEEELQEVVITGSRIAGVAPVGATVTTLGREEIEGSGQVTLDRLIQDLPQVFDIGFSENSR